jgi:hypothetical protein
MSAMDDDPEKCHLDTAEIQSSSVLGKSQVSPIFLRAQDEQSYILTEVLSQFLQAVSANFVMEILFQC